VIKGRARIGKIESNLAAAILTAARKFWWQLLARPISVRSVSHTLDGVYLCSSSTPPGGGVHGMSVIMPRHSLRDLFDHDCQPIQGHDLSQRRSF